MSSSNANALIDLSDLDLDGIRVAETDGAAMLEELGVGPVRLVRAIEGARSCSGWTSCCGGHTTSCSAVTH